MLLIRKFLAFMEHFDFSSFSLEMIIFLMKTKQKTKADTLHLHQLCVLSNGNLTYAQEQASTRPHRKTGEQKYGDGDIIDMVLGHQIIVSREDKSVWHVIFYKTNHLVLMGIADNSM